jgi:hypothetical protein
MCIARAVHNDNFTRQSDFRLYRLAKLFLMFRRARACGTHLKLNG